MESNEKGAQILQQLIEGQRARLLTHARAIIPYVTEDDILQPNDFSELEFNPQFRYEEGVLAGLLSAQIALRCRATVSLCDALAAPLHDV